MSEMIASITTENTAATAAEKKQQDVRAYIDYMYCNGLVMGTLNSGNEICSYQTASHVPFAHNLYEFKQDSFNNVVKLCPLFNKLVHNVANDYEYLMQSLAVTTKSDEFTRRLMEIMTATIRKATAATDSDNSNSNSNSHVIYEQQNVALGILRSDYMVHAGTNSNSNSGGNNTTEKEEESLKQVEINTIASSFGVLSTKLTEMQQFFHPDMRTDGGSNGVATGVGGVIPDNDPLSAITAGIAKAHFTYLAQTGGNINPNPNPNNNVVVLMIVQPSERNIADQRPLEYLLRSKYGIVMLRATMQEVYTHGRLEEAQITTNNNNNNNTTTTTTTDNITSINKTKSFIQVLQYRDVTVSTVYFRGGYTPTDYTGEEQWAGRLLMEKSYAIKCPSIGYHLAGCKKIQQTLASAAAGPLNETNILTSRFGLTSNEIIQLRSVFTGLYSLDPTEIGGLNALEALKNRVIAHPEAFVLKPQREGGGNNIYGEAILSAWNRMSQTELNGYILMDRIVPPTQACLLIKDNKTVDVRNCICEIGIYGVYLNGSAGSHNSSNYNNNNNNSNDNDVISMERPTENQTYTPLINTYAGYLLRVKPSDVDEGGVAAGFGVLGVVKLVK